jgi:DNA-binding beta-propeller fold protein YncE
MKPRILPLVAFAALGCEPATTSVVVAMDAPGLTISQLSVDVALDHGLPRHRDLAAANGRPQLPGRLVLLLPDVAAEVTIAAHATDDAGAAYEANANTMAIPHREVHVMLRLGAGEPSPDLAAADLGPADVADLASPDMVHVPTLSLIAGEPGGMGEADGRGATARFDTPWAVAVVGDTAYVVDAGQSRLRKIDAAGNVTTLALIDAVSGQPHALLAPSGVLADGKGNLYVAERLGCDLKRVRLSDGATTLVAGQFGTCDFADGTSNNARFREPIGLALEGDGNLWVADAGNLALRLVILNDTGAATVSTPAGEAGQAAYTDGDGNTDTAPGIARFTEPRFLAFMGGALYVTDGTAVRKVVTTTTPVQVGTAFQPGASGPLQGLAPDGAGALVVFDAWDVVARRIVPGMPPLLSTVAGQQGQRFVVDGPRTMGRLRFPVGAAADGAGHIWFVDEATVRTLAIGGDWRLTTVAGLTAHDGDVDDPPRLRAPTALAWDGADTVYVAEYRGQRVRKLSLSKGTLSAWVGAADAAAGNVDARGNAARFAGPSGLALDGHGNLFVADADGHVLRRITPAGDVTTIAGTYGSAGAPPLFSSPSGLAFDGDRTIYVADAGNHILRTVDTETMALGTVGTPGKRGDGDGPAATATFDAPHGLALDRAHHILYVANYGAHTIRQMNLAATDRGVTHLAGTSYAAGLVDAKGGAARFNLPLGLALDAAAGTLYVADGSNHAVRRIDLATQQVSTYAGNGTQRTTPGPLPAEVHTPWGLAVTTAGLYIASSDENAVLLAR